MNADGADHNLKPLFHELRTEEARRAPSFSNVLRKATDSKTAPARMFGLMLTACVAVVIALAVSLSVFRARKDPSAPDTSPWTSLTQWKAPTDVLLNVSNALNANKITTPTDSWLATRSFEHDTNRTNRKDNP
jgi:hypothetical protein